MWDYDADAIADKLIKEYDDNSMPLPVFETEPHLLISKIRKHYMEYVIKLLSANYEHNQRLINKNIYLPSAIWRCAKNLEMKAAQACMMVQIYRNNINPVIKQLKNDTKKGKLNKTLYEYLHKAPENEKKLQTDLSISEGCNCYCRCGTRKRRCNSDVSPNKSRVNGQCQEPSEKDKHTDQNVESVNANMTIQTEPLPKKPRDFLCTNTSNGNSTSADTQKDDELTMQLEKLFHTDPNDEDLLESSNYIQENTIEDMNADLTKQSLDERLASITGLLFVPPKQNSNVVQEKPEPVKEKKHLSSRWICEEYFMKSRFYELLDQIGDINRKKLVRIKEKLINLFGDDVGDEGVLSPLEETPHFVMSCKERIAPIVVKFLTSYYIKGRIIGKVLFKSLAKHLILMIYQCSRYPDEHEVSNFVNDFLENRQIIRCEADFKDFKIDNI